jgi:hypothetical protein
MEVVAQHFTVIGDKHNDRIYELAEVSQLGKQPIELVIDVCDRGVVSSTSPMYDPRREVREPRGGARVLWDEWTKSIGCPFPNHWLGNLSINIHVPIWLRRIERLMRSNV